MPTPDDLLLSGKLVRFRPNLLQGEHECRRLYLMRRAVKFCQTRLPALTTDGYVPGAKSPLEQLDDEFTEFTVAPDYPQSMVPRAMSPLSDGVWELRTADLRVIGWFWRTGSFIAADLAVKADLNARRVAYSGYIAQTVHDRARLSLDPPAFVTGELADVL